LQCLLARINKDIGNLCITSLSFFVSSGPLYIALNPVFSLLIRLSYYVIGLFLSLHVSIESNIRIAED